jgi:hypothetical protein
MFINNAWRLLKKQAADVFGADKKIPGTCPGINLDFKKTNTTQL